MNSQSLLMVFVTLVVASAFLYIWRRRDDGRDATPGAGDVQR